MTLDLTTKKEVNKEHVKQLINTLSVDNRQNKLFFGTPMGLERYDIPKYPKLAKFFNNQLLLFWRPEQYNMDKDRNDFNNKLSPLMKKVFTENIGFQIVLDTIQSRGIPYISEYCTNAELSQALKWWDSFENLHSYSYTYVILGVYADSEKFFKEINENENILKRVSAVTKYYDDLLNTLGDSEEDIKKKIYLTLVSVQILEAVRFYVSFACSYYFAENNLMHNNAKVIQLINRDENLHLGFTKDLIKILVENKEEGFQDIIKECEPIVEQMWKDAYQEECDWADYLLGDEDIMGLKSEHLKQYMSYLVNQRMKICGFEHLRWLPQTKNPFPWITKFTDSKNVQSAPQETDLTSYTVNGTTGDGMDDLTDLSDMMM